MRGAGPEDGGGTEHQAYRRGQRQRRHRQAVHRREGRAGRVRDQCHGFKEPGKTKITDAARQELERAGIRVLAATHVLSGAERGISRKHGGVGPVELMADTLRMLGQGVKVCVEIAVMALDAGLIPHGEEIMVVAGSGRGADTAVIMHPAHANNILDTKINEIVCKPKNF